VLWAKAVPEPNNRAAAVVIKTLRILSLSKPRRSGAGWSLYARQPEPKLREVKKIIIRS
jgi:hypothetical protein